MDQNANSKYQARVLILIKKKKKITPGHDLKEFPIPSYQRMRTNNLLREENSRDLRFLTENT